MDALIAFFSVLLAASAMTFFLLSWFEGRRAVTVQGRSGAAVALEDLVGASHPLAPHTIRQTRLE
jgi:hypothetical protein